MKKTISGFKNYEIPTKKLSMIAGGYFVAGSLDSSCSTATGSSDKCDDTSVCNCHCNFVLGSTTSADITTCFNANTLAGLSQGSLNILYQESVGNCEGNNEVFYLQQVTHQI